MLDGVTEATKLVNVKCYEAGHGISISRVNFVAACYKASVNVGNKSHSDFTNIMAQLLPGHRESGVYTWVYH